MQPVPTSRIKVGERIRRDLGDLAALAASIEALQQLQPIVVTPEWQLLAGERRLRACEQLGRDVLVRVVATAAEALAALDAEAAENLERKPWTPEETTRYALRRLELERAAAEERRAEGAAAGGRAAGRGRAKATGSPDPEPIDGEEGRAATRAAAAAGMSRRTFERAAKVVEAADADPARFGGLLEELNRTGKVAAVAAKLERAEEGSDPDSWCTPSWVLEVVHAVEEHGITLDPCSNANAIALGYVRAATAWTIDDDALAQQTWDLEPGWTIVWFQPPYSDPAKLTARCVDEYDRGVTRVWALVKLDTSTGWWAQLRDRAPILILPRRRLAHVVGDRPRKGSDFCSGMLLLTRERGHELQQLQQQVQEACGDKADAYLAPWAVAELLDEARSRVAQPVNSDPATLLEVLDRARETLAEALHMAEHPPDGELREVKGEPLDVAVREALRAVAHARGLLTYRPMKTRERHAPAQQREAIAERLREARAREAEARARVSDANASEMGEAVKMAWRQHEHDVEAARQAGREEGRREGLREAIEQARIEVLRDRGPRCRATRGADRCMRDADHEPGCVFDLHEAPKSPEAATTALALAVLERQQLAGGRG